MILKHRSLCSAALQSLLTIDTADASTAKLVDNVSTILVVDGEISLVHHHQNGSDGLLDGFLIN